MRKHHRAERKLQGDVWASEPHGLTNLDFEALIARFDLGRKYPDDVCNTYVSASGGIEAVRPSLGAPAYTHPQRTRKTIAVIFHRPVVQGIHMLLRIRKD